jgi:hypothetical protein
MSDPRILPADRYLASLLGISDEDYALFKAEVEKRAAEGPQPSVVAGAETLAIISLVLTVLSVGFTIAASFFKPQPDDTRPAQLKSRNRGGRARTENERFAPRYGFDSAQDITTLGAIVPLVYALREITGGVTYGGVRVNTSLLWSQIYSLGGSQMLRAIFLIGEGPIGAIDTQNFAAGGNTLASYNYGSATAAGSRMTVYGRYTAAHGLTSRINSTHYVFGRNPSTDKGAASSGDIFLVNGAASFSSANRPNNQTTFGVYNLIGNDFGFRLNPTIKPFVQAQLIPEGEDGDAKVRCTVDDVGWAQRKKAQTIFGSRSGITSSGLGSLGGTTTYTLYRESEKDEFFSRDLKNIQDTSKWTGTVKQVFADSVGAFNKPVTADVDSKGKWVFDFDNTEETSLINRIGVTITNVTVDEKGKGKLFATITFNTGTVGGQQLWDEDVSNEDANTNLLALQSSKFRIIFKNPVDTTLDDDEELEVKYTLRVRVKHKGRQKFKFTGGGSSGGDPIYDDDGVLVGVTPVTLTPATFEVDNKNFIPTFKIRGEAPVTSGSSTVTGNGTLSVDVELKFNYKKPYVEFCEDVASSVAGRQKTWDDSLIQGELYKIGSGLAVCTGRTPEAAFVSQADISGTSGGQTISVNFSTVRTGAVTTNDSSKINKTGKAWIEEDFNTREWRNVATTDGHILRCAIASISTSRACKIVELGIRSRLGIRVNGICNFKESLSFDQCNDRACPARTESGDVIVEKGSVLKVDIHQSNTISAPVERYSFFAIYYREAGSVGSFTKLSHAYGMRGATQQNIYNYIQLEMPSIKQWEIQLEPYSGWEVRNGGIGTLYVLDASLSTLQTISEGGVTVRFAGTSVAYSADTFAINVGRRKNSKSGLGIARSDTAYANEDFSYIDTWGKLAEAFIYEEVQSSASSGPEHEVVYINEIVPNATAPLYDNLALLGVNIMSSVEWQQFNQFSCYVTAGKTCRRLLNGLSTGSTHLFPDVLLDLLTNTTYGAGNLITDQMIDFTSFQEAAQWCQDSRYFYDGVIADRVNLRQWAADIAATHLLIFGERDGKFFLRRALPTTAVTIRGLFTAGNITEGSFQLQYLDPEDRDPIQVSVRYREERASTDLTNPGLFPVVREVIVREASTPEGATMQSLDMSDYCTNPAHAIDAAKYIIRMRRIPTHSIRFTTTHEGVLAQMAPSDYIRVAMDTTEYDQFNNGVVTASGSLVSTKSLSNGTYDVIAWNGEAATAPYDTTLTVSANGAQATPTGIVFTVKIPSTQVRTYQIERITPNDDGTFTIEAVHMPTNGSGVLNLAESIELGSTASSANWTIQG